MNLIMVILKIYPQLSNVKEKSKTKKIHIDFFSLNKVGNIFNWRLHLLSVSCENRSTSLKMCPILHFWAIVYIVINEEQRCCFSIGSQTLYTHMNNSGCNPQVTNFRVDLITSVWLWLTVLEQAKVINVHRAWMGYKCFIWRYKCFIWRPTMQTSGHIGQNPE